MTGTIYVPPGDEGDEVVKRLLPNLHKMAQGKRRKNDDDS